MAERKLPPPHILRQLLDYDPATGLLTWRERPPSMFKGGAGCAAWNYRHSGTVAGHPTAQGYLAFHIHRMPVRAHRVAWAWMSGEWPDGEIDHINGKPADNRWANLRCVSRLENAKNQSLPKNNKCGIIGVRRIERLDKWAAQIGINGSRIHLGCFDTIEEAATARRQAERKFGFHENHGRR